MARLRVVYGIDSLGSGGAQRQAVELACWLVTHTDVAVEFLVYHENDFFGPRLRAAGVPVTFLPKRAKLDPTLIPRILRWLRRRAPDVVHAFMLPSALWMLPAARALGRARPVFIAGQRDSVIRSGVGHWLQRRAYLASDAVTVNSEPARVSIRDRLGIPEERLHYLPNGIDLAPWDREASGECPLPLEEDRFHFALIGGLRTEKNHLVVLDALARMDPGVRAGCVVWFVGDESGDPALPGLIRERIRSLGLEEIVRLAPQTRGIAALMRRLGALLLPSDHEGFPNALLEAMASRLPAIATPVGEIPRLIQEGQTGLLVPRGDADALARALERLRRMAPEERVAMGARARAVVEERYALERVAAQHVRLYEELQARHRPLIERTR